jgi:nitroreductase
MSAVYVKFLRDHERYPAGAVVAFDEAAAWSLVRKGMAALAPADLVPSMRPRLVKRQPEIETAMAISAPEMAVERRGL